MPPARLLAASLVAVSLFAGCEGTTSSSGCDDYSAERNLYFGDLLCGDEKTRNPQAPPCDGVPGVGGVADEGAPLATTSSATCSSSDRSSSDASA